jgi:hypothetical protein
MTNRPLGYTGVYSTKSLDVHPGDGVRFWTLSRDLVNNDESTRDMWPQLRSLHEVLKSASHAGTAGHGG